MEAPSPGGAMSDYYDRTGAPIGWKEWALLFEDTAARRIGYDETPSGHLVSTVWLGLDHRFGEGPPLIFETMVFGPAESGHDLECERYSTEEEAKEGHARILKKWSESTGVLQ